MSAATGVTLLDEPQRAAFERDGYLFLRQVLAAGQLDRLRRAAAAEDARFRRTAGAHAVLNRHDLLRLDPAFVELVEHPVAVGAACSTLGWNVQLFHTQLVVTPPAPKGAVAGGYGWHQDNNRMNLDFETPAPHPRVSVKLGYLLSPLPRPGMGNLCVSPGTHLSGRPEVPLGEQPEQVVEVCGEAGDAVLFDRRVWHAASTNTSEVTRVMLFYGYSHRWIRPKCDLSVAPEAWAAASPVLRQLLGACTSANGYYDPQDDDVPLRSLL